MSRYGNYKSNFFGSNHPVGSDNTRLNEKYVAFYQYSSTDPIDISQLRLFNVAGFEVTTRLDRGHGEFNNYITIKNIKSGQLVREISSLEIENLVVVFVLNGKSTTYGLEPDGTKPVEYPILTQYAIGPGECFDIELMFTTLNKIESIKC